MDCIQCIESMRISPIEAFRFNILLYQMVYMLVVHSTLSYDIKRLETEFTHRYRFGTPISYISIYNLNGEELSVKNVDISNWSPH